MTLAGFRFKRREQGFSLLLVMSFMVVSFLIISGVLYSTSNAAMQTVRHQRYYSTQEAATAAAERAVAGIVRDVNASGAAGLLSNYEILPDATECPEWVDYDFGLGVAQVGGQNQYSELLWKYSGLSVTNTRYQVLAGARTLDLANPITNVVGQYLQVAEIPLFAYMAYSEFDLSFITRPGVNYALGGRIHSNREIYMYPSGSLTFTDHVTAAGEIHETQHPADSAVRTPGTVTYQRASDSKANSMILMPGASDSYSLLSRMANQADLFVVVNSGVIQVHDGLNYLTNTVWTNFVTTNIVFFDFQELLWVHATVIDVDGLSVLGWGAGSKRMIHLDDITPNYGADDLAGFELVNGQRLPAGGLSVVTTNSLYVKGNYNVLNPVPAMLAADAVTVVSASFDESNTNTVGNASDVTLHAGIITGTVPSDASAGVFDGGFFNALRLIEDWEAQTLTFRGAIATPFASRYATEPWREGMPFPRRPPTTRVFIYETGFQSWGGMPKGSPVLYALIRGELETRAPGELAF